MAATRPTILQIIPELDTGGAELSTVEIAQAIVEAGGRALVLSQGGRLVEDLARVGGELMLFPAATKNPVRIARNGYEIARIIKRENVDLIHARSRAPAWSALIAARRTGIPFVTTYHGAYGEKGRLKKLYNSVMARSDLIIANSHYTAGLVASRYRTPSAGRWTRRSPPVWARPMNINSMVRPPRTSVSRFSTSRVGSGMAGASEAGSRASAAAVRVAADVGWAQISTSSGKAAFPPV